MPYVDPTQFESIKQHRIKLGLSLEQVSSRTSIPVQHLTALEEGDVESLPAGPYLEGYYRSYCKALGLTPHKGSITRQMASDEPPVRRRAVAPLWLVRGIAGILTICLLGWFGFELYQANLPSGTGNSTEDVKSEKAGTTQALRMVIRRTGHFRVRVDQDWVLDGTLSPGDERMFSADEKIEVIVPGAGAASLEYNGRLIVPQGLQDKPRRLLFVDDKNGGS
jgi:hypothetical protein